MSTEEGVEPPVPSSATAPPAIARDEAETQRLLDRRERRRRIWAVVAVVLVALVLLGATSGLLPFFGGSGPAPGLAYSEAKPLAVAAVPASFGANPVVLLASAVASPTAVVVSARSFANLSTSNCTVTELSGYPASGTINIPSFSGDLGSGRAPFWVFAFEQTATGPYAIVMVDSGGAAPIVELSGPNCNTSTVGALPLPSTVVDSPSAAATAWSQSGQAYVRSEPAASTLTMTAFGGATTGLIRSPLWLFVYAPCTPLAGGATNESAWVVAVGLTSGAFFLSTGYSVGCPP